MAVGAQVDSPQRSTGWWRHGAAGAARVHRSSVLHGYGAPFLVVFLPTELAGCEELTKVVFNHWGAPEQDASEAGRAAARLKLQGMAHDKVGQNGCGIG
jgi:hypothetical protein